MKSLIKKSWLTTLMVLLLSGFALTSCDDDDSAGGPLVGTWSCDGHYYGGTDYYTFKSDGTYSWECPGTWFDPQSGHYTYNNGLLVIVNSEGTNWTYFIQFVNKNTFVLTDEDGYTYTYTKE